MSPIDTLWIDVTTSLMVYVVMFGIGLALGYHAKGVL